MCAAAVVSPNDLAEQQADVGPCSVCNPKSCLLHYHRKPTKHVKMLQGALQGHRSKAGAHVSCNHSSEVSAAAAHSSSPSTGADPSQFTCKGAVGCQDDVIDH